MISDGSVGYNCDDVFDDLAIMMVLMFVIDEDIDGDNSRGDDDGVNTSRSQNWTWGRRDNPRYAPRGIQLHMDGQEHDNA